MFRPLAVPTVIAVAFALCGCDDTPSPKQAPAPSAEQMDASLQPAKCTFDDMAKQMDGIPTVSWQEAADICNDMTRRFGAVPQLRVIRKLARAASLMAVDEGEAVVPVAASINDVAQARGQSDPVAIMGTYEVVFKAYEGSSGQVTPGVLKAFLKSAGPMAHTLSDDGILNMVPVIANS